MATQRQLPGTMRRGVGRFTTTTRPSPTGTCERTGFGHCAGANAPAALLDPADRPISGRAPVATSLKIPGRPGRADPRLEMAASRGRACADDARRAAGHLCLADGGGGHE